MKYGHLDTFRGSIQVEYFQSGNILTIALSTENVIVYGRHLETLTCLETLMELPVPPHRLVLVLPPGDEAGNHTQLTHDPEARLGGVSFRRGPANELELGAGPASRIISGCRFS